MSLPVAYLPEARDDINAAYHHYDSLGAGLGDRFLDALRQAVERIADNPDLYAILHRDVRAAPLRRFPYVIYYRAEPGQVLVVAVQHGRRSSKAWSGRA